MFLKVRAPPSGPSDDPNMKEKSRAGEMWNSSRGRLRVPWIGSMQHTEIPCVTHLAPAWRTDGGGGLIIDGQRSELHRLNTRELSLEQQDCSLTQKIASSSNPRACNNPL